MALDIKQIRIIAEERRFAKAVAGEFPVRDRARPRDPDKQIILDTFIKEHMWQKGICRLKNGQYVLLGTFPEVVASYIREHKSFPVSYWSSLDKLELYNNSEDRLPYFA